MVASAPGSTQNATPVFASAFVQLSVCDAGFDGRIEIVDADAQHAIHARQIDRHAALDGVDVSLERRAGTERHDRRLHARGRANDRADFISGERKDDDVGVDGRVPRLAVTVLFDLRGVGAAAIPEESPELGNQRCASVRGQA
jgi:hypothetical protein